MKILTDYEGKHCGESLMFAGSRCLHCGREQ